MAIQYANSSALPPFLKGVNPRPIGKQIEILAQNYLCAQGLQFRHANYHCRRGEIDLIMQDHECIVFVEVRYRQQCAQVTALESISRRKQRRLLLAAKYYLQLTHQNNRAARFDVIAVTPARQDYVIDWIKNAITDEVSTWG